MTASIFLLSLCYSRLCVTAELSLIFYHSFLHAYFVQISRARKRPGKRVRVDEIILVPDFSGTAI